MSEHDPIKLALFSLSEAQRFFSSYIPEIHAPHEVFCVDETKLRVGRVYSEEEAKNFFESSQP